MGARGTELVRSKYTWDAVADQMIDTYYEGMERYRRTPGAGSKE
jgi:hypothetical protein